MNWMTNLLTGVTRIAAWLLALSFCIQANATLTHNDGRKHPQEDRVQTDDDKTEAMVATADDEIAKSLNFGLGGTPKLVSPTEQKRLDRYNRMLNRIKISSLKPQHQQPGSKIFNPKQPRNQQLSMTLEDVKQALRETPNPVRLIKIQTSSLEQSSQGTR